MSELSGKVFLVGAGPGDAGLMTLKAAELLNKADVVLYDALVNREILKGVREDAELIYGGKRREMHAMPQKELQQLMRDKAREGKCVVRLKGGDPYTFGRGGEEGEDLAKHGVAFEVVPGVSAVHAVPAYAGIPVTHRDYGSGYVLVSGHEDPNAPPAQALWEKLAALPLTKVVMMGLLQIDRICKKLIECGMDKDTPAAMIQWGTLGRQKSVSGTIANICQRANDAGVGAPVVAVIGEVARLKDRLNWFENKPLFGKRVILTRAAKQNGEASRKLQSLGAQAIEWPMVKFDEPERKMDLVEAMAELNGYDWLIFTSANGVEFFFQYFFKSFSDIRDIGGVRIAAVGDATAAAVRAFHLNVDLVPSRFQADAVAETLKEFESVENLRILIMRAEKANPDLPRMLEAEGAIVDDVGCYRTVPDKILTETEKAEIKKSGADWILFTSGSTASHLHRQIPLGQLREFIPGVRIASIGSRTSTVIRELGGAVDAEAKIQSMDSLIDAIAGCNHRVP